MDISAKLDVTLEKMTLHVQQFLADHNAELQGRIENAIKRCFTDDDLEMIIETQVRYAMHRAVEAECKTFVNKAVADWVAAKDSKINQGGTE